MMVSIVIGERMAEKNLVFHSISFPQLPQQLLLLLVVQEAVRKHLMITMMGGNNI